MHPRSGVDRSVVCLRRKQLPMGPEPFPTVTQGNISDEVYDVLRRRICRSSFAPGQRLRPAEIERQMGISRTPLQQALHRLAAERLVRIIPRKGTYVTAPTQTDIAEVFEIRRILEIYAAQVAVPSISEADLEELRGLVDEMKVLLESGDRSQIYRSYTELDCRFHELIVDAADNQYLRTLWRQVSAQVRLARMGGRSADAKLGATTEEHAEIAQAFMARDSAHVLKLLDDHIRRGKRSLLGSPRTWERSSSSQ